MSETEKDLLIEKIKQEKIVFPVDRQDIGWNNAIDYILEEVLGQGDTSPDPYT